MPAKRSMTKKPEVKNIDDKGKRFKSGKDTLLPKAGSENSYSNEEQLYLLQREKSLLLSEIQKKKKELFEMRTVLKQQEFKALRDSEKKEQKFEELSKNVEIWTEYFGMTINHAVYTKNDIRKWHIEANGETLKFEMDVCCATNELTNKGYVKEVTILSSDQCKQELQPWFDRLECNAEQIFKLLKVYDEMNQKRQNGLNMCKEEFGSIVTVYQQKPSGETVIELGSEDAFYFQIKWKLSPSIKHIAKMKNVCRIACTEDGDKYIKENTDLSSIKKKLGDSPIDVIRVLAKGIAKRDIGK